MQRAAGVFLNVSSMMGEYGIGGFSKDTSYFIDEIIDMGFHIWQVLPITTIGAGNSPYSGCSSFAGNYLYIDPEKIEERLISKEELNNFKYSGAPYSVDYGFAFKAKRQALELAYSRLNTRDKEKLETFYDKNKSWLEDYSLYMMLKTQHNFTAWYEWEEIYRNHDDKVLNTYKEENLKYFYYFVYEQYVFFEQWKEIKKYANGRGVAIFGDMPIYVSYDSVDVWANPQYFLLDENKKMTKVAGVPPDYFAKDGQLWNNPLYHYENLKKENYKYLINRILHNLSLYDILRIDHFRGFYQYYAIDSGEKTAKNGKWCDGPKMEIWKELNKFVHKPSIIAEDLGQMDNNVRAYVKETGFMGMKVFHFGFDGDIDNLHIPYNYDTDSVAYTGTHDNNTTLGWLYSLDQEIREKVLEYVGFEGGGWGKGGKDGASTKLIIKKVLESSSQIAIIPFQDLVGYGQDTRLNIPGKAEGNWCFRATYQSFSDIDEQFFRTANTLYGRNRAIF